MEQENFGLRNIPGAVPEPDELIGRDHLIDVLWDQLAGNNLLLIAPRRFGKTGVMRHVLKKPRPGYHVVYIEVEAISTPESFAAELIAALLANDKVRSILSNIKKLPLEIVNFVTNRVEEVDVEGVKIKLKQALGDSWQTTTRKLLLEMEKTTETPIFIIDEFPQFIDNISRSQGEDQAKSFLSWFRSLRMRQKDELRRFRFILGGSTGIDVILRRLRASDKLNDCFRLPVEPVSRKDGERIIEGLAQRYELDFTEEAIESFFELIGTPVPYFIHLFVSQIILDPTMKGKPLTPQDLQKVYRLRVVGPSCRSYFDYFRQRLERYGVPGERAAIAVLREIAEAPKGRISDSALYEIYRKARKKGASDVEFREIMADLECDWYVSLDTATNEYFFLIQIMKAWWNRFYGTLKGTRK